MKCCAGCPTRPGCPGGCRCETVAVLPPLGSLFCNKPPNRILDAPLNNYACLSLSKRRVWTAQLLDIAFI